MTCPRCGVGREEGRVGLHEDPVARHDRRGGVQVAGVGERDGPGERHVPAMVGRDARHRRVPGEAVEHHDVGQSGSGRLVEQDPDHVVVGVAVVDHQCPPEPAGHVDVRPEGLLLDRPGRRLAWCGSSPARSRRCRARGGTRRPALDRRQRRRQLSRPAPAGAPRSGGSRSRPRSAACASAMATASRASGIEQPTCTMPVTFTDAASGHRLLGGQRGLSPAAHPDVAVRVDDRPGQRLGERRALRDAAALRHRPAPPRAGAGTAPRPW